MDGGSRRERYTQTHTDSCESAVMAPAGSGLINISEDGAERIKGGAIKAANTQKAKNNVRRPSALKVTQSLCFRRTM